MALVKVQVFNGHGVKMGETKISQDLFTKNPYGKCNLAKHVLNPKQMAKFELKAEEGDFVRFAPLGVSPCGMGARM